MSFSFNCGQTIVSSCVGKTVYMDDAGWQALFGEISSDFLFIIKFAVQSAGSNLTYYQIMAINSLRCVFTSGFENSWYILGAIYYFASYFGY